MRHLSCCALFAFLLFCLPASLALPTPFCQCDISGLISSPGQADEYFFEANAGDTIVIRTFSEAIFLDAKMELYWAADDSPIEPRLIVTNLSGNIRVEHVFSQGGAWVLRYSERTGAKTGAYMLNFQRFNQSCGRPVLPPLPGHTAGFDPSLNVFPNPVSESASIRFDLARPERVRLDILDFRGAVVQPLANGILPAGPHAFTWRPCGLPAGVYICRLALEEKVFSKKIHFSP